MKKHKKNSLYHISMHVILPASLTVLLFVGIIVGVALPQFKATYLQQKRQLIKELVGSTNNLMEHYYQRQLAGELTQEEAQQRVLERIRAMRYGLENKDYFWVHDLQPIMVMHPYRLELEGQSVADLKDSQGKHLILEMNEVIKKSPDNAGYVDYMWQWKDDPNTEVPKLSYVRLFEPWGLVIGTGIYLEDVRADMRSIVSKLEKYFIFAFLVIGGISGYFIWHGFSLEGRRQKVERQRERLMKSIAIKNEELESIVHIASHDLRSPLINIKGFAGELESSCRHLSEILEISPATAQPEMTRILNEDIPESIRFIKTGTEKMKILAGGLLQLSRLGVAELELQHLDMNQLVEDVLSTCQYQIKSIDAKIECDDLPPCKGDYKLVNQILTNLIDNAIKYAHPDRTLEISISGQVLDNSVEYAVSDNGLGIDKDHLAKIFDMFKQLHPKVSMDGVGLGLTIVKRILGLLDGQIRVESESGRGTTFYVTLPSGPNKNDWRIR